MYMYMCVYIYIHTHTHYVMCLVWFMCLFMVLLFLPPRSSMIREPTAENSPRLRTNGVNTNGAAAKVINFDRLGEKGTPWHFWEYKSRLARVPERSLCQKT